MEKYLQDLEAWCWKYKKGMDRNYEGLHFTAKPASCQALIQCLDQLCLEKYHAHRTIQLKALMPADEAKITGGRKYSSLSKLRIALHVESDRIRQMSFRIEGDTAMFDLTQQGLPILKKGLTMVASGSGDYSIGPEKELGLGELDRASDDLWFWPCFGHLGVA